MRVPRARAASGECGADTTGGGVESGGADETRVLTPLNSNAGGSEPPAPLPLPPFTGAAAGVDSLNSGLTRTTVTLTPTTLRSIEETFMALEGGLVAPPAPHHLQAGFVTPQVAAAGGDTWHQRRAATPAAAAAPLPAAATPQRTSQPAAPLPPSPQHHQPQPQGHSRGGRRPKDDDQVSPEEDHRRRVRRERNKQAAARCRRRRMDLTNTLQEQTEELEDERTSLEREIQMLTAQKDELSFLLEAHRPCCKLGRRVDKENAPSIAPKRRVIVKQESAARAPEEPARSDRPQQLQQQQHQQLVQPPPVKQPRPTTLPVVSFAGEAASGGNNMHRVVSIGTPSQGLGLNFDSLMQGGTGLTPIGGGALPQLPAGSAPPLVTPLVGAGGGTTEDGRRDDMLSPGVKDLVSL